MAVWALRGVWCYVWLSGWGADAKQGPRDGPPPWNAGRASGKFLFVAQTPAGCANAGRTSGTTGCANAGERGTQCK